MNSFYSSEELLTLGFGRVGINVSISRNARFYGIDRIMVGDNVRIDDFCILSGKISIGSNVHISAFCALYGAYGIEMNDYSGLSPRCTIFSATDDFSGDFLVGPQNDHSKRNVIGGTVYLHKYVQIGSGSVILPDVTIAEGVAVGAMSLVNRNLESWKIYAGVPVKIIKDRSKSLLNLIK